LPIVAVRTARSAGFGGDNQCDVGSRVIRARRPQCFAFDVRSRQLRRRANESGPPRARLAECRCARGFRCGTRFSPAKLARRIRPMHPLTSNPSPFTAQPAPPIRDTRCNPSWRRPQSRSVNRCTALRTRAILSLFCSWLLVTLEHGRR